MTNAELRLFSVQLYWFAVVLNDDELIKKANLEDFPSNMREILEARKLGVWNKRHDRCLRSLFGVDRQSSEKMNDAIADWFASITHGKKNGKTDWQSLVIDRAKRRQNKQGK